MSTSVTSVSLVTNPQPIAQCVASQIRTFRKRRGMTLAQLAERCEELGAPQLQFAALANIERGATAETKRKPREVSLVELAVLARALQVPPALLMFPVGTVDEVELTPGLSVQPWMAVKWWIAEGYLQGDQETWWSIPLLLFRQHEVLIGRYAELLADGLFAPRDDAEKERRAEEAERTVHQLRELRHEIRANDLTPPPLDADMAYIDERRYASLNPRDAERYIREHPGDMRVVDAARPGRGKVMRPGDADKLDAALKQGLEFTEEFNRTYQPPADDGDES
jgi:transcriptional regulator with XRE-family HTH domain